MIKLPVDEGYAYDYYAILLVKWDKRVGKSEPIYECAREISNQVGQNIHSDVLDSKEFQHLLEVNKQTFEAVDDAKIDRVPASVVHNLNHARYLAKKALQEKFFPKQELTEVKN